MRLFIVWLLVLLAYIVINPPSGKARVVANSEITKPAEVNQDYLLKHDIKLDSSNTHSSFKKTLIK
ncbi:MAG: hypothetical protein A3F16_06450 [Deltaproteobacteria bacterium RIFCSPHIGHO2_12_FULL_43_9]|nr:MAG: hypothetical protein A3F16_06450 [Deltaproteobacteria bacterium RIFCSPHIGHO2_12_FULL_43_9]